MPYGYGAPVVPATGSAGWNPYGITPTTGIWNPGGVAPTAPTTTGAIPAGAPATLPYVPTNVPQTTTTSNISDIPNIETLTKAINDLNIAAQQQANVSRIPGEAGLEAQSSDLIKQQLGGQVPADVINLLKQQGAEQNVGTGRDSNAAYLRALGLTSLGQEQAGQAGLTAATARNPLANLFDPSSQLLTPAQAAALGLRQQEENLRQQELALQFQRLFGPSRITQATGTPNTDLSMYSGTGGTAMSPPTGPMGLPPDIANYGPSGDYVDQPYQDWIDALYSGVPSDVPAGTVSAGGSSLAPGSPGTYWDMPPTGTTFNDLSAFAPGAQFGDMSALYGG